MWRCGRGRGRGRGGRLIEPHIWANMSHEDRIKHTHPPTDLDTKTLSLISAVTQVTLDNLNIDPTNNTHSSKSRENLDTHDTGNNFEGRNEAQTYKKRKNNE